MLHDIVTVAAPASCDPAPSSSPVSDGTLTVGLAPLPEFGAAASFGVVWSTPVYAAIPTVTVTELGETIRSVLAPEVGFTSRHISTRPSEARLAHPMRVIT